MGDREAFAGGGTDERAQRVLRGGDATAAEAFVDLGLRGGEARGGKRIGIDQAGSDGLLDEFHLAEAGGEFGLEESELLTGAADGEPETGDFGGQGEVGLRGGELRGADVGFGGLRLRGLAAPDVEFPRSLRGDGGDIRTTRDARRETSVGDGDTGSFLTSGEGERGLVAGVSGAEQGDGFTLTRTGEREVRAALAGAGEEIEQGRIGERFGPLRVGDDAGLRERRRRGRRGRLDRRIVRAARERERREQERLIYPAHLGRRRYRRPSAGRRRARDPSGGRTGRSPAGRACRRARCSRR